MGIVYFELARVMHKINFVTERLAQLLEGKPYPLRCMTVLRDCAA